MAKCSLLAAFTVIVTLSTIFGSVCSLNSETQALLEFKKQLKDPGNVLRSWVESDSPCQFSGVKCVLGKVTEILLDSQSLGGEISPSVSGLKSLESLVLPYNSLSGKLPAELTSCGHLRVLNISNNNVSGEIPDLSGLQNLEILELSANFFSGKFPTWIGKLTGLVQLALAQNSFDEGTIPDNLGNLKNLTYLYLASCNFVGEIPASIFQLKASETFDFSTNNITGDFPKALSTLKNLKKIELWQNKLTGVLPVELAELTHLQEIDVSVNMIHGNIPKEYGNWENLTVFQCYSNNLSGELPSGFGEMRNLIGLSLYRNNFSGQFPANLGRYSPLGSIDISENHFSGPFPKFLCGGGALVKLLAIENNFSGEFPDTYGQCKTLQRVRFMGNNFSGNLPNSFWALPNVDMLDFSDNGFTGSLSPHVGLATNLTQLMLSNNKISGELPQELAKLTKLEKLLLNSNNFTGTIPSQFGALQKVSSLHLENNLLSGPIPSELGNCRAMVDLDLAVNHLTGEIPKTFTHISALNSLNLSNNKLVGAIPGSLASLKLSAIDLQNNELSGIVPPEILIVGGDQAFRGNNGLCISDKSQTLTSSKLQVCDAGSTHHRSMLKKVWLCIILSVLAILIVALLILSYRNYKRTVAGPKRDLEAGKEVDLKWKFESFHPVHIDADDMNNLSDKNLIGSGGTGKVYRVDLKKSGHAVAVKQIWKGNEVQLQASEMNVLTRIRHKNILKLYACLTRGDSHYLVFEFMSNGNLSQVLKRVIKGQPELDWCQRFKIAVGSAKGIAYLHHDCSPPILHRDIKSSNILLDGDNEPKIADFGVAKVAGKSPDGINTGTFTGTHGYIAPELGYSLKVTEKSDVYSFGVVLLELVTGKEPVMEEYGDGKDIVYWVEAHLSDCESVTRVFDPKIPADYHEDMLKVLKIAVACTSKIPSARPTMRDVVKMLIDADPLPENHQNTGSKKTSIEEIPMLGDEPQTQAD